jgi:hypothetical protein
MQVRVTVTDSFGDPRHASAFGRRGVRHASSRRLSLVRWARVEPRDPTLIIHQTRGGSSSRHRRTTIEELVEKRSGYQHVGVVRRDFEGSAHHARVVHSGAWRHLRTASKAFPVIAHTEIGRTSFRKPGS